MGAFADRQLFQFTQSGFVSTWLETGVGLSPLFNVVYRPTDFAVQTVTLGGVAATQFARPVRETVRVRGVDEQIVPTSGRVRVEREHLRAGRLAWVDVSLDVTLTVRVVPTAGPIERVTARNLLDKLGPVASLDELRAKLTTLYAPSVVDALFRRLRITSLADFVDRPAVALELVYQAPPAGPGEDRAFAVPVCVQVREDAAVRDALRDAKLCREALTADEDFAAAVPGAEVVTPVAFVVVFPAAAVTADTLPGVPPDEFQARVRDVFAAEQMLARFA